MKNPNKFVGNELKYITKVLNSKSWSSTGGNWSSKLENEFAKKLGLNMRLLLIQEQALYMRH